MAKEIEHQRHEEDQRRKQPEIERSKDLEPLRNGTKEEKLAILNKLGESSYFPTTQLRLATIDLLGTDSEEVREKALKLLLVTSSMSNIAWKIAYELRERSLYSDELVMPLRETIEEFRQTPALGVSKSQAALKYVRSHLLEFASRKEFEKQFRHFSRDEATVSLAQLLEREKDKTLCIQCGKKMAIVPMGHLV